VTSVQLLSGQDEALLGAAVGAAVHALVGDADRTLAVEEFDGDGYDLAAVVDAAQTPPFLTARRIVVARGLGRFKEADWAPLLAYLAAPLDTTDLVLATADRPPRRLVEAVKEAGGVVTQTEVGGSRREREAFIDDRLAAAGLRLDAAAKAVVGEHLGEDLGRLASVLETLEAAFGPGARVGVEDLGPFLGEAGSVPSWDLTDAIDRGDTTAALTVLARLVRAGGRHPLVVMAILHAHYGRMLRLDGSGAHDRASALAVLGGKVAPYPAQKALDQARRLGSDGIARAITLLGRADLDLRGASELPEGTTLEVLVARLSRLVPARAAPGRARR
jgi:DNA polymerase-3 subunit delta